jgi:hypothetical protein
MFENGRETFELIHAQCFSYQWNESRDIFRIEGDNIKQNQSLESFSDLSILTQVNGGKGNGRLFYVLSH